MNATLRTLPLALLGLALLAPDIAHAEKILLSGGYSGNPAHLSPSLFVPDWRVGARLGQMVLWGTTPYVRFKGEDAESDVELKGWAFQPRVGLNWALAAPKAEVSPYVAASLYTLVGGLEVEEDGDDDEPETEAKRFFGGTAGFGLDAKIHEKLSIATETGLDGYTLQFTVDDDGFELNHFNVYAAIYLHIGL